MEVHDALALANEVSPDPARARTALLTVSDALVHYIAHANRLQIVLSQAEAHAEDGPWRRCAVEVLDAYARRQPIGHLEPASRVLTCVYCGHEYPQHTPAAGDQVLTDHIRICPRHPLREAEATNRLLRDALVSIAALATRDGDEHGFGYRIRKLLDAAPVFPKPEEPQLTDEKGRPMTYWGGKQVAPSPASSEGWQIAFGRVNGYLPDARAVEVVLDAAVPEWITKLPVGVCLASAPAAAETALPSRDLSASDTAQGLYRKFEVRRTDGSHRPGGKHHGCEYFVLDMTHDPHAPAAARTYADSVEATHPTLATDMRERYALPAAPQAVGLNALECIRNELHAMSKQVHDDWAGPLMELLRKVQRLIDSQHKESSDG